MACNIFAKNTMHGKIFNFHWQSERQEKGKHGEAGDNQGKIYSLTLTKSAST